MSRKRETALASRVGDVKGIRSNFSANDLSGPKDRPGEVRRAGIHTNVVIRGHGRVIV